MPDTATYDWWFGDDDLLAPDVEAQAEWKEHPFEALEDGKGLTLYRRASDGNIDHRDAAALLTVFACREAAQLLGLWNAPGIVRDYLTSCDLTLSERAATAVKAALDEADKEMQNAAMLAEEARARCPKLGFLFSRGDPRCGFGSRARIRQGCRDASSSGGSDVRDRRRSFSDRTGHSRRCMGRR